MMRHLTTQRRRCSHRRLTVDCSYRRQTVGRLLVCHHALRSVATFVHNLINIGSVANLRWDGGPAIYLRYTMTSRIVCCLSLLVAIGLWLGTNRDKRVLEPEIPLSIPPLAEAPIELEPSAEFEAGQRAHFHPHGDQVCLSGCAVSNHPTGELSSARFDKLLNDYATQPVKAASLPLETLLFYGRQTRQLLKDSSPISKQLSSAHMKFLRTEIARSHIEISLRLVDVEKKVIARLPFTRVPFDRRHEFQLESSVLPPLKMSGTVKRVGLYNMWTRL